MSKFAFSLPLVLLGVALASPAVAQTAAVTPPAAKLDPKDPDAIRCRKLDVTGSLVKKEKVCKTNAQWNAISEQQRRDGTDLIERSRAGMNPNG